MNKIKTLIVSRTFWTVVIIFVINGISGIHDSIPASIVTPIDAVLSILAAYFHVSPKKSA